MNFGWGDFPAYFKEPTDNEQKYTLWDFRVRFLTAQYALFLFKHAQSHILFTDFDTPGVHSTSTHYEKRALDLGLGSLPLATVEEFAGWINGNMDYGYGYVPAVVGRFDPHGKHNDHLHLQAPSPYQVHGRIDLRGLSPK
jgi:hypothetical protein